MRLISHRGNIDRVCPFMENTCSYIDEAISKGYDVEVDIWNIAGVFYLGHDSPEYEVDFSWLEERSTSLWIHAKNFAALEFFILNSKLSVFYHNVEYHTLIGNTTLFWSHKLREATSNSIIPLLTEECVEQNIELYHNKVYGICSDYVKKIRDYDCEE